MGRTCCAQKLFLTFRTISVHNMFSPCSAKRRASDKDLPVLIFSSFSYRYYFFTAFPMCKVAPFKFSYVDRLQAGTQKREVHQIV